MWYNYNSKEDIDVFKAKENLNRRFKMVGSIISRIAIAGVALLAGVALGEHLIIRRMKKEAAKA